MTRVLVVDDEPQLLRALQHQPARPALRRPRSRPTAPRRSSRPPPTRPTLVILDLGLPDMDGTEVIAGLRGWTDVPILVLSGRSDSLDKVDALDAGADDYVTKPFAMDELLARLRAMTRRGVPARRSRSRSSPSARPPSTWPARKVTRDGADVRLTPTEWHLLEVLVRHPGKLLSQRQLLAEVWGPGYETAQGNLRLYMAQLRRKLEPDPSRPRHLLNEPGMGYRFEP